MPRKKYISQTSFHFLNHLLKKKLFVHYLFFALSSLFCFQLHDAQFFAKGDHLSSLLTGFAISY
jgi:hypothetical protein